MILLAVLHAIIFTRETSMNKEGQHYFANMTFNENLQT